MYPKQIYGHRITADLPPTVILTTPTMMMVEIRRMTITTASVVPILASGESWESKGDRKVKNLPRIYKSNYYNEDTQNDNVVCPQSCVSVSSKEFVNVSAKMFIF